MKRNICSLLRLLSIMLLCVSLIIPAVADTYVRDAGSSSQSSAENNQTVDESILPDSSEDILYKASIPDDAVQYNGHYYKYYDNSLKWNDAKDACKKMGGHLATISSAAENSFIANYAKNGQKRYYFIGLYNKSETDYDWKWVTGEKVQYTNWNTGEPNVPYEPYVGMYVKWQYGPLGKWNNTKDTYTGGNWILSNIGYICEWDNDIPPTQITIYGEVKTLAKGSKVQLSAKVKPSTASQEVKWSSSNDSIASVDKSGKVLAKKAGKATITAACKGHEKIKDSFTLTVIDNPVKSITISCDAKLINTTDTLKMKAKVSPSDAIQFVDWSSSNNKVATISAEGKLTAVAKGTVTITATAIDGSNKKASVKIKVQEGMSYKDRQEKIKTVQSKYAQKIPTFISKENSIITEIKKWFTSSEDSLSAQVNKDLQSAVAVDAQLPTNAKTVFLNKITEQFYSDMEKTPTMYNHCKTVMQLFNQVMKNITAGKSSFPFKADGESYIVEITTFSAGTAYASLGWIRRESDDRKFTIMFTSYSDSKIKETLKSLSEFAQSNMKKACDDALKDLVFASLDATGVSDALSTFKEIQNDPIYGTLVKEKSKVKKGIEVGVKAFPLLKEVVKVYKSIMDFDLDSVSDDKLTKKADEFATKIDAFHEAIYDFMK